MQTAMTESKTGRLYDLWSWIYDYTFGMLVRRRQRRAIEELAARSGERVLDLGVGTGMTLHHYPDGVEVVGMDLSRGMLEKALDRVRGGGKRGVHLLQADAMAPPFVEGSFDHVVITHVISVVSDPHKLLEWAARVTKPGGQVIVLNHFQSNLRPVAAMEKLLNPLFVKIGWRSDLALPELLRSSPLRLSHQFKLVPYDLWRIVVLRGDGTAERTEHADRAASPAEEGAGVGSERS